MECSYSVNTASVQTVRALPVYLPRLIKEQNTHSIFITQTVLKKKKTEREYNGGRRRGEESLREKITYCILKGKEEPSTKEKDWKEREKEGDQRTKEQRQRWKRRKEGQR